MGNNLVSCLKQLLPPTVVKWQKTAVTTTKRNDTIV